jgi:DNA helicase IV
VIDEAQDLAVQEASLLGSLVDPKGALTVSADFHQIVSPVHGMTDAEALKFGLPIWDQKLYTQFPFQKNLRQSREIGLFLVDFFGKAFHEYPSFDAGPREEGTKPTLYTGRATSFVRLIKQMVTVLQKSAAIRRVALLQVDDEPEAMERLRRRLAAEGVRLADAGTLAADQGLITASVERVKGLEFDACIVLGLDSIERSSLNFAKNRGYVALSRPTQRLFMLCEHFPPLLQQVRRDLFEHHPVK